MAKGEQGAAKGNIGQQSGNFYSQQQPAVNMMGYNYGYGSGANTGDYTDIMNRYRQLYGGSGYGDGGGGGGGGGFSAAGQYTPFLAGYSDPFKSYSGYEEFSKTGGYSPEDIANMRARGVSPVRAAYANAEREMSRNRALQGGYSPNFAAASAKMAREQSQGAADALQGVEAGLAQAIREGRLAGLGGMSGIEGQRLGADVQLAMFNAQQQAAAQAANLSAAERAAAASAAGSQNDLMNQMRILQGMTSLYGTTPGMSQLFGNQLLQGINMGGQYGLGQMGAYNQASQLPNAWDTWMNRIGDIGNAYAGAQYPW